MNFQLHGRAYIRAAALFVLLGAFVGSSPAEPSHPSRPIRIEGTLRDTSGSPVSGASILLAGHDNSVRQEAKTDEAGKFAISVRRAGTYVLRVEKAGFRPLAKPVTLPFEHGEGCDLVLARAEGGKSAEPFEFSDQANFTVAGVTDWTAAGGHGSDSSLRTSESLARRARELTSEGSSPASGLPGDREDLIRRRDELHAMLKKADNADGHRELGDVEERLNDPLAAEQEYERARQLDPSEPNYFAWGTELLLHRAIQPAAQVFTAGIKAHPGSERMLVGLGAALYASGLYSQAAERVCAASDLAPSDRKPYLFLGKMLETSPETLSCMKEKLARFAEARPEDAAANYYYALALSKSADNSSSPALTERVQRLLEKSIRIDPKFAEAYLQLGILHAARGDARQAASALEQATHANPDLAEAHFRLAQIYKKTGEFSKARQEFDAHQRVEKREADAAESKRRQIQQFVVVFKDPGPSRRETSVSAKP